LTKVLKYLKKYWYFALLTPLFMVIEVSMDLVQPSLMSRIVDEGIVAGDIQLILNLGGQMLIFTIIGCLGGVFRRRAFRRVRKYGGSEFFERSAQGRIRKSNEDVLSADR